MPTAATLTLSHLESHLWEAAKPWHQERLANTYHDFKDIEGFAKVAFLEEIRLNDGNLSIPLYVRGQAIGEAKGEYAADGLKAAVRVWEASSRTLENQIESLLEILDAQE